MKPPAAVAPDLDDTWVLGGAVRDNRSGVFWRHNGTQSNGSQHGKTHQALHAFLRQKCLTYRSPVRLNFIGRCASPLALFVPAPMAPTFLPKPLANFMKARP